ncbi:uncharacterized protein [Clytia hemisphaerica]|uniref:uncharacterized protein n=1 Tax=Clytia hemisphaerica TaxID=252671 RepID=UPI0034D6A942
MSPKAEVEAEILIEEITDLIIENPISSDTIAENDAIVTQLLDLRIPLRNFKKLFKTENLNKELIEGIEKTLQDIREYFKLAREFKQAATAAQVKQTTDAQKRHTESMEFTVTEIIRLLTELTTYFQQSLDDITDAELIEIKNDKSHKTDIINKVVKKYELILQTEFTKTETKTVVSNIGVNYKLMTSLKSTFYESLDKQIKDRDVYKQKLFNNSKLNITLHKFSGADTDDFYTFKDKFNKLHLHTTPKHLLPELLKNNFLKGPALSMVKSMNDIDNIWKQLKFAYGDVKMMLSKKIKHVASMEPLSKSKNHELAHSLSRLITAIKEIIQLAEIHGIEQHLYYSEGLHHIYSLLGEPTLTRWLRKSTDEDFTPRQSWYHFVKYLEQEQKLQQTKLTVTQTYLDKPKPPRTDRGPNGKGRSGYYNNPDNRLCNICDSEPGQDNHLPSKGPAGKQIIQYHTCHKFAELSPANRYAVLQAKGYCYQCLFPGASISHGRHKEGKCQRDFACPHASHQDYPRKHILVCHDHKDTDANKKLLEKYKSKYLKNPNLPPFTKNISLSFHSCFKTTPSANPSTSPDYQSTSDDEGIYLLQNVVINHKVFTIFFDSGCSDFIVKHSAIKKLGTNVTQESSEITSIGGVGTSTQTTRGTYNVQIPMMNGQLASLRGVCMDQITSTFPRYPLTEVFQQICKTYSKDPSTLPKPSAHVGGDVHLMLGIKYNRYYPKLIYQLPSGLAIYQSVFRNSDGGSGIIGGPHQIFTAIHNQFYGTSNMSGFFTRQYKIYKDGININPDASHLSFPSRSIKRFETSESTGSEITYRCVSCRNCKDCKNSEHQREISIKEEVEQSIIDASLDINLDTQTIIAKLPFIDRPSKLAPNKDIASRIYYQQLKKLDRPENNKDKADILESEAKLQKLGYVEYVENLAPEQQSTLRETTNQNFIPWRAVWKESSVSTPCRVVFDASHPTSSGVSLNDILAKGQNNYNKLQNLLIRWSTHLIGIHTDIRKMYNTINLHQEHWQFQRYIWQKDLDPSKIPKEKIIKTLIYGVRSSGNQAECGLRSIGQLFSKEYPEVNRIIKEDVYVDDCITGESSTKEAFKRADELQSVINRGNFTLKGFTFSGMKPTEDLSEDGSSISVGGMRWFPETDELTLSISDLNFSKKRRGKKSSKASNIIPDKLTRRDCASKVAEIFDLTGKMSPIVASMKLDLHELTARQLDWNDIIPDELRQMWLDNFKMMKDLGEVRFKRAIVPEDALNTDIHTLDFGDSSKSLICTCIYARFQRKNGSFSCQLVFARTRTVPKGLSLPRAELLAALINTHTGEVVRRSFGTLHKSSLKFTDSQIALHWISNDEKPLKLWVRNRVVEINRFKSKEDWFYIPTNNMIADLGTRRGATIADVSQDSKWMNGMDWMRLPSTEFPIKSAQDLKVTDSDIKEIDKERTILVHHASTTPDPIQLAKQRYQFSKYLIDPNHRRFSITVRILAYVIRFCKSFISKWKQKKTLIVQTSKPLILSNEEIIRAEKYFYQKGTMEVQHFLPKSKYDKISQVKDNILMYTGRILPTTQVSVVGRYTDTMKDLTSTTFMVPILDNNSPIAYSIASEVHWHDPNTQHCGIETTLRHVLKKCFIINGRNLMKRIKRSCQRCRFLEKRTVQMAMGPIPIFNLTIAPSFYFTQMDLSGPYSSYSPHHKRTTVKVWLIVFCCCSTSAVKIKTMDDYSTTAFIQAITRFAADHGFPKRLMCDEGSQLVKGCKEMNVNLLDLQHHLSKTKVDFQVCPVQGHNMNGKVERKIQEINNSISKSLNNQRLSILQWETLTASIANQINNLPLAIGDVTGDFECLDLITPNRLMLGRNNDRAIDGLILCDHPTKILKDNEKVFDTWFDVWLTVHVPKLVKQTKWYVSDQISVGDIVLFIKHESSLSNKYTYGLVKELEFGDDLLPRKAKIVYRNENETVMRETHRAVRGLVIIHHVDECDYLHELGILAKNIDFASKV